MNSNFETKYPFAAYGSLKPLVKQDDFLIYSHQSGLVNTTNLFSSSPPVSNVDHFTIIASTFLLTYNPATDNLKMPFHCSCLDYLGEVPASNILIHHFQYQIGIAQSSIGRYNSAWMSDSSVAMALNVYQDVTLNWEDNFPFGYNYLGTFWLKINPVGGNYIATPMLSQNGSAINFSINGTPNGDYLFPTGILRGNGVQMSPDGTIWDSFEGDSLYEA